MVKLKQIEEFLGSEPIALAGVSRNPKKFGSIAFTELKKKGMTLIPVNPNMGEIAGSHVYPGIGSLPEDVKGLIIATGKDKTAGIVREAIGKGIKQIWIQQMAESKEALDVLRGSEVNYITGECILMYYKPDSVHKFHGLLKRLFRRYPK